MSDHGPIQSEHREVMNGVARALSDMFPGCTFVLLIAPPEGPAGGRVNYISNGERRDMVAVVKEWLARATGQPGGQKGNA